MVAREPDRIDIALARIVERRHITLTDALNYMLMWSRETRTSIAELADIVLAENAPDHGSVP